MMEISGAKQPRSAQGLISPIGLSGHELVVQIRVWRRYEQRPKPRS